MTMRTLMTGCQIATMLPDGAPYGLIDDGAIVVEGREIRWVGPRLDLPQEFDGLEAMDLGGRLVTPGLIDAHSHVVYGGNRAKEFEMRLSGASYEEIAKAGGGILSTVTATRAATQEDLVAAALPRVDAMIAEGVTTLEIKSGYGLTPDTELTMLRAARDIAEKRRLRVKTTYLAAHAVPPEFAGRADEYIDMVVLPTLRQAHGEGLVDAVDGFCEGIAFAPDQIARVFDLAKDLGLPVKLHAEQLSNLGGAALAASYGALSADHIEYLDDQGVAAMAKAGTIAVLLPGAFYTLKETQKPPVASLRKAGVPMAVATDCNPGSSPMTSLLLAMNMACTFFGLTPQEALAGTTRNAARALGLSDAGVIAAQKRADLAVWDVSHPAELAYTIGMNPLHARVFEGRFQ